MGAASLRRSTIANASKLPLPKVVKRYCAPVSGAISLCLFHIYSPCPEKVCQFSTAIIEVAKEISVKYSTLPVCLYVYTTVKVMSDKTLTDIMKFNMTASKNSI